METAGIIWMNQEALPQAGRAWRTAFTIWLRMERCRRAGRSWKEPGITLRIPDGWQLTGIRQMESGIIW